MKKSYMGNVMLAGLMAVLLGVAAPAADLERALDSTVEEVAQDAAKRLKATEFADINNVAILPLWGDCDARMKDYLIRTLQSSMIGGRYRIMERHTAAWDNLLSEMQWDVLQEDTMNQQTIQRFGRIEGCDAVIYGTLRECALYPDSGQAVTRLTLTMGVVETGEAKWSSGEVKSVRFRPSAEVIPPAPRNPALIRAINKGTARAAQDLKGRGVPTSGFCMFPLLGQDADGYVTGALQSSLANAGCGPAPVSPVKWQEYVIKTSGNGQSVETMRAFARDNGYTSFLYGTVHECQILERKYQAVARVTLSLVSVETGQTVWSPGEVIGSSWLDWPDAVRLAVSDPVVWVLGGLLVLLIIWRILRSIVKTATRPR